MTQLFSSPGKQASQGASGAQAAAQNDITGGQQYWQNSENNLRGAIAGLGPNPFFAAADSMSPSKYAVNPNDVASFGEQMPNSDQVGGGVGSSNPFVRTAALPTPPSPSAPRGPRGPSNLKSTPQPLPNNPFGPVSSGPVAYDPMGHAPAGNNPFAKRTL